ncbi:MAG: hypothetical protein Q4C70_08890 [Planctomycetia bacterium]|nr:hypothetical protein [Planctomycetia bacterium]
MTNSGNISNVGTISVEKSVTNSGTISNFQNITVGTPNEKGEFINNGGTLGLTVKDGVISEITGKGIPSASGFSNTKRR